MFDATIAIIALSTAALSSPASAQQAQSAKSQLYAFHTGPVVGGCPGLDWHITLEPNNTLMGFVAWDQGKHMARLAGALNKDRTFEMDAQEIGGAARKATVRGTARGDYVNVSINGSGTACDGNILSIPRATGGIGGGGG
ncbi:MAG: hypothetical protein P4L90_25210 [Rhodopila sp.]|nr:hypothetical protein [Rhodopila sp.]